MHGLLLYRAWLLWEQFQKKSELFQENVLLVPHGDDFRYSSLKEWEQQFHNLEKLIGYINNNSEMNTQVGFCLVVQLQPTVNRNIFSPFYFHPFAPHHQDWATFFVPCVISGEIWNVVGLF